MGKIYNIIKDTVEQYKNKVNKNILTKTVLNDLIAKAREDYAWLLTGLSWKQVDASYSITIKNDGTFSIIAKDGFKDMAEICKSCPRDSDCKKCMIEHPDYSSLEPKE